MDQGVTVLAGSAHGELRSQSSLPMTYCVALVAQSRPGHFQRVLIDRAMRVVTVEAVFAHWRMLEQERSALFSVALVASVIDRIGPQHRLTGSHVRATVWIMAIRAHHFALARCHVR